MDRVRFRIAHAFPSPDIFPFANSTICGHVPLVADVFNDSCCHDVSSFCSLSPSPLLHCRSSASLAVVAINFRGALLREIQTLPENRNGGRSADSHASPREKRAIRTGNDATRINHPRCRYRLSVFPRRPRGMSKKRNKRAARSIGERFVVANSRARPRSLPRNVTGWRADED